MTDRYPGYDVLDKRWTQSWNEQTRQVIDRRLAIPHGPRFFSSDEWLTLGAVCERIMPQPRNRPPVPLPAYVDQKMADGLLDGYRYAQLPPSRALWRQLGIPVTVEQAVSHLLIDIGRKGNRRAISWLRHDPLADRAQSEPLVRREETRSMRYGQAAIDHLPRLLVPGLRPALVQHVVAWITISHRDDPPSGRARRGPPAPG